MRNALPRQDQQGHNATLTELEDTASEATPKENSGVYKVTELMDRGSANC